ncbi:hypothetical protein DITRI_Ditri15bG0039400 [Diplodiscus trichospermus]
MLVLVKSRFRIPPVVTIQIKGSEYKILVPMDDYKDIEIEEITDKEEGTMLDESMEFGMVDGEQHNRGKVAEDMKGHDEGEETMHYGDFDPGVCCDSCNFEVGSGSRLIEEEIIGGEKRQNNDWLICVLEADIPWMDEMSNKSCRMLIGKENNASNMGVTLFNNNGVEEERFRFDGPIEVNCTIGPGKEYMDDPTKDPEVKELLRLEKEVNIEDSDISISDEDIMHWNSIILKEANLIWETSKQLGVIFEVDKEKIISRLVEMKFEDWRG